MADRPPLMCIAFHPEEYYQNLIDRSKIPFWATESTECSKNPSQIRPHETVQKYKVRPLYKSAKGLHLNAAIKLVTCSNDYCIDMSMDGSISLPHAEALAVLENIRRSNTGKILKAECLRASDSKTKICLKGREEPQSQPQYWYEDDESTPQSELLSRFFKVLGACARLYDLVFDITDEYKDIGAIIIAPDSVDLGFDYLRSDEVTQFEKFYPSKDFFRVSSGQKIYPTYLIQNPYKPKNIENLVISEIGDKTPKLVGAGAFKTVYHAQSHLLGETAVKICPIDTLDRDIRKMIRRLNAGSLEQWLDAEATKMDKLFGRLEVNEKTNRNIVRMVAHYKKDGHYIFIEKYEGEDLAKYAEHKTLSLQEVLSVVRQLSHALNEKDNGAHHVGLIHGDIKPENILVTEEEKGLHIRLADWGTSMDSFVGDEKHVGSLFTRPPEYFTDEKLTYKWDIWAIGIVAYNLVFGKYPDFIVPFTREEIKGLAHTTRMEKEELLKRQYKKISEDKDGYQRKFLQLDDPTEALALRYNEGEKVPESDVCYYMVLADIIQNCLAIDPEKRSSASFIEKMSEHFCNVNSSLLRVRLYEPPQDYSSESREPYHRVSQIMLDGRQNPRSLDMRIIHDAKQPLIKRITQPLTDRKRKV